MSAEHFSDAGAVASYAERTRRAVPGLDVLHRLTDQLLAETVPPDGRVLVVGAGGGLELKYFAERHDDWRFDGVDPSPPMLQLARDTLGPHAARVTLHDGDITSAPAGPFDAATCLLVLHFLTAEQRLHTLREIHRRLRPGAPLLTFHHSAPAGDDREHHFTRYARAAAPPGVTDDEVARSANALATKLPAVTPEDDAQLLRDAGFTEIQPYYVALTLHGWHARA